MEEQESAAMPEGTLEVVHGLDGAGISGKDFEVLFSCQDGGMTSYKYKGKEMLEQIPKPNFWRAPTENDRGSLMPMRYAQWKIASLYLSHKEYAPQICGQILHPQVEESADCVRVTYTYRMPTIPESSCRLAYEVHPDGSIRITLEYDRVEELGDMPEFGVLFKFDADYHHLKWYGLGPEETYADRKQGAKLGVYRNEVADNMTRYLVPQECGNKEEVRYAELTDENGRGIRFSMDEKTGPVSFSALPFTPHELEQAAHPYELPRIHYSVVRVAKGQMGVGGDDSWQATVHPEYLLQVEEKMQFSFWMQGIEE